MLFIYLCIILFFFSHSPFRQHKTKDKHEIDRMTMTMVSDISVVAVQTRSTVLSKLGQLFQAN